jgi:hypothetical protein
MLLRGSNAIMVLLLALAGCGGKKAAVSRAPLETLDDALSPATAAAELRKLGGAHVHATTTFRVDLARSDRPSDGSKPSSPSSVTTTTDLWLDKQGNFRLLEVNDQDGGREIVRVAGEIAVALRYGKMVRRAAQDVESTRYLGEAMGAPWAAWETVRRQVEVEGGPTDFRLRFRPHKAALPPGFPAATGLRKWRDSVALTTLEGQATLQSSGKALVAFACKTSFEATRDGAPIEGDIAVSVAVDEIGKTATVVLPQSETLRAHQRTVLEEKALLGGIAASAGSANRRSRGEPRP